MASVERKKILLLGGTKSGKTSIVKTVFDGLNPNRAMWIEMTREIAKTTYDSIIPLEIWDTPGSFDIQKFPIQWKEFAAIVFVIDLTQEDKFSSAVNQMHTIFINAYAHNPRLNFEVFLHKADSVHNDWLGELYREINQRYTDEIWDYDLKDFFPSQGRGSEPSTPSRSNGTALSSANANIFIEDEDAFLESLMNAARFFMTSVHDTSLQEAWGRVMQSLIGPLYGPIEGLMSTFARTNNMEKAFLFDINAKFNVAADDSITETKNFHLSTDYIGKMLAFQGLFEKLPQARKEARRISFGDEEDEEEEQDERDIEWPSQIVRLSDGKCLVYWQISKRLALLGACSAAEYDKMQGMMEFNVVLLRQGILDMLEASEGL
ncbi:GTP-binding protein gtr2 [Naganishia albida]|nr:GTP-binding protein gtr2 [Naganishia albida]